LNTVSLFYMSEAKYGGFATYTSHLCRSFRERDIDCSIYKIRNQTEARERPFMDGLTYRNLSLSTALEACYGPSIITATDTYRKDPEPIRLMLMQGCGLVIHDKNEINADLAYHIVRAGTICIAIRKVNVKMLESMGVMARYIPHPYVPCSYGKSSRIYHAVSTARLDWDKKTHWIAEANTKLPSECAIHMFGAHNRSYMFRKIYQQFPGWEDKQHYTGPYYHGAFEPELGAAVGIYSSAGFAVDLSEIKGDGGGTQYTFLEAIDAGTPLVLNTAWFRTDDDTFVEGRNCLAIGCAEDLVNLMLEDPDDYIDTAQVAKSILVSHAPGAVIPEYTRYLDDLVGE